MVNPYCSGACPFFTIDPTAADIMINAEDVDFVYIEPQSLGFSLGYGDITVASDAGCVVAESGLEAARSSDFIGGRMTNGVITFPSGALRIGSAGLSSGKLKPANTSGKFKLELPETSLLDAVAADSGIPEYYNLQGMKCVDLRPGNVYIKVSSGRSEKILVR